MNAEAQDVTDFWFGAPGSPEYGTSREAWFRKDPAFDASIARRFGRLIERALGGELRDWDAQPDSALARIVVLDQFTRNVFRDTARAFAGDALALQAAKAMVAAGHDRALAPERRSFVYLPFEHAEDRAAQDESVRLFTQLETENPALTGLIDYALRHRAIVARFGRFPHRNAALGRPSTPEEIRFLEEPGSRF
jgi:uncharacterized protein (DUF924 family)